jgi:hypothetical protein
MKKLLFLATLILAFSQSALAGVGGTGLAQLQGIAIIKTAAFGHKTGNVMEIRLASDFTPSNGVICAEKRFIDTMQTVDPDRALFNLLRDAKQQRRNVLLYITDDPTKTVVPGRCSLVAAEVL